MIKQRSPLIWCQYILVVISLCGCGFRSAPTITPTVQAEIIYPTPADTLDGLIRDLASEDEPTRIISAFTLENYGEEAAKAIPNLIQNLYYPDNHEVRRSAIYALRIIGPAADKAVPDLIKVWPEEKNYRVQVEAVRALGAIRDRRAVPSLIQCMEIQCMDSPASFQESSIQSMWYFCALSIGLITGEEFRDVRSTGYTVNNEGIPNIVIDARQWWEEEGQYQDWSGE